MLKKKEALSPFVRDEKDFRIGRTGFSCFDNDEDSRAAEAEYLTNPQSNEYEEFDYSTLPDKELSRLQQEEFRREYEDMDEATRELLIADRKFQEQVMEEEHAYFSNVQVLKAMQNKTKSELPGNQPSTKDTSKKFESCFMTKAKPLKIYDDVSFIIEDGMTFAISDGEKILLMEGVLRIAERRILLREIYSTNGKVIDYSPDTRFKVLLDVDGAIYNYEVDVDSFDDGKFLSKMSLGEVSLEKSSDAKRLFAKYAKMLRRERNYETVKVFEKPGWKSYYNSDVWYYVLPTGVIGNPLARVTVENNREFGVPTVYTGSCIASDFLSMRDIFREHKENAVVCQYYLMLAVLKSLLRERNVNPQFLLAIIGETNAKKTTLSTLFFKLYERECGPDIDFTATKVALEEATAANADAVTIFDDVTPPNSKYGEQELKAKVEALTRTFGGNLPRKRSKIFCATNSGVSEFTPVLGQGVITGEVFPVTLKSSRARIVKLEFKGEDCNDGVLSHHQQHLEFVPSFVMDFLAFVTNEQGWLLDAFCKNFEEERKRNPYGLVIPRFRETYAMFSSVVRIFGFYLASTGVFSDHSIQMLMSSDLAAIGKVLKVNDFECNQKPDEALIAEFILDMKYAQENGIGVQNPLDIIHEDESFLEIHPKGLFEQLKRDYQKVGKIFPFGTPIEFHKFLAGKALIKVIVEGDKTRYTPKGKDGRRYLKFFKEKLMALAE